MGILQQYWKALGKAKAKDKNKTKKKKGKGKKNPYSFFDLGKDLQKRKKRNEQILKDMEK